MKRLFLFISLFVVTFVANAQHDVVIQKIKSANEQYKTVTCNFTQSKTMAMVDKVINSEGVLFFNRADKLKMDYTTPQGNLLLITGESLVMVQGNKKNDFNTKQNAQMRNLKNTLLFSIAGDVDAVAKENGANVEFAETSDYYKFVLVKADKQVKSRMTTLELSYSKNDYSLCVMVMEEANGTRTTYNTPVKMFNKPIDETVFEKPKK